MHLIQLCLPLCLFVGNSIRCLSLSYSKCVIQSRFKEIQHSHPSELVYYIITVGRQLNRSECVTVLSLMSLGACRMATRILKNNTNENMGNTHLITRS